MCLTQSWEIQDVCLSYADFVLNYTEKQLLNCEPEINFFGQAVVCISQSSNYK